MIVDVNWGELPVRDNTRFHNSDNAKVYNTNHATCVATSWDNRDNRDRSGSHVCLLAMPVRHVSVSQVSQSHEKKLMLDSTRSQRHRHRGCAGFESTESTVIVLFVSFVSYRAPCWSSPGLGIFRISAATTQRVTMQAVSLIQA